uniref:Ribosome biogenesis regulatory protein n=1 Tax=Globisporangium ultimum (strain ATCC 200006 / CBS 805.95 / DAOM BR144) TaxID=431595 RepID=K3X5D0_GLOUD
MAVKASEIAPAAYATDKTSEVKKEDDLTYDLGNLAAFDTHPFTYKNEKELALHARENVQLLINQIFDLPREMSDMGPLAKLPEPTLTIPREKPLPKPKVETKWEKFAKEKGIDKRKKSRMAFDEEKEEWAPSWGYKRAGDDMKDWAVEMKEGDLDDPWTKRKQDKRARVEKNLKAQANNLKHGRGKQPASSLRAPAGIPVELMNTDDVKAKQRGKEGVSKTLEKVQFSTASMGKFDKMREGEKERKQTGKRNKFLSVTGAEQTEKERSMNVLKHVLGREENAGKAKGKANDDDDEQVGGKRKKVRVLRVINRGGPKLKNITKGHAKKARSGRK